VYTVIVEGRFFAVHRVDLGDGSVEPQHGHDWMVRVHFSRPALSDAGLVIDFAEAQSAMRSVIGPLEGTDLNTFTPLRGQNPTAEVMARYIFDCVAGLRLELLRRVEVTESPGCVAAYEPS